MKRRVPVRAWLLALFAVALPPCALLRAGADEPPPGQPSNDLAEFDALITSGDREHWAFQPVADPPVPAVGNTAWVRNPIDAFILSKLEARGWKPAAEVDRGTWLRRVYLDVIGMPPTPAEQARFAGDTSPDACERVVDALLAHPGYGERWGRHWLDVVRYAESNGYERDAGKPQVWRYRDYVIRSLNVDKPYDRFVLEQLAGDELPDANAETLIALGYTRLGPWDDEPADFPQDRADQLDDLVQTTSRAFLGLTLGCARCHNHKFDPLTMHDYYRMVAVFDPLVRPQNGRTEVTSPAGSRAELEVVARRDAEIARLNAQIDRLLFAFREEYVRGAESKLPAEVLAALRTEVAARTEAQRKLIEDHHGAIETEVQSALPAETRGTIASLRAQIDSLRAHVPDLPQAYFMFEPSAKAPVTHILLRGRASSPGPVVQPGVPAVTVAEQPTFLPAGELTTRRRLSLAQWLVDPANPLTARVIVNRVWQFHFGEGIVSSSSDFGTIGAPPTHPELLDWLARYFVHEADWSLKKLHRLILTSSTYRMSKRINPEYARIDPENMYFWRFPYQRLEVEAICDSVLAVSGRLNDSMYGESVYLQVPQAALAGSSDPGSIWRPFEEKKASRRTIYAFTKRSFVVPILEVLDLCDTTRSSEKRRVTSVPTQALTLYNGQFINRQAELLAARLTDEAGSDPRAQIDFAYRLTLCRSPKDDEMSLMLEYLDRETASLQSESARTIGTGFPDASAQARRQALVHLCRALFNLNEFVYPD